MRKTLVLFLLLTWTIQPRFLDFLLPTNTEQLRTLLAQNEVKAWHTRLAIGFVVGFCSHAFCPNVLAANVVGIPLTAGGTYTLNKYIQIITNNNQWLDVTNAYVIGALTGYLAQKVYSKFSDAMIKIFNNPKARVALTQINEEPDKK